MSFKPIRKQISLFLPVGDWRLLRSEAARRRQPMTALCLEWMEPGLNKLRRSAESNETPLPGRKSLRSR
jgi:hypothetical protein